MTLKPKTYISPSLSVVIMATEGVVAASDVKINSAAPGGNTMDSNKMNNPNNMWGNNNNKGIWD